MTSDPLETALLLRVVMLLGLNVLALSLC